MPAASIDVIIKQMILSTLRSAKITSASPDKTNHFIGIDESSILDISGELEQAIAEIIGSATTEKDTSELAQDLLDSEEKKKKKGRNEAKGVSLVKQGIQVGQNPMSTMLARALPLLPHTVLLSFAISLAPMVFAYITRPGGPLDVRWKRVLENEFNAFMARQTQKDTMMGVRQVIIQSKIGFTASNGVNNYNTQRGIREGGINPERDSRIQMVDHTKGLW